MQLVFCVKVKGRPCGFGQSLGRPIVRSISHFLKKTGQKIQESEQKRSETGQIFFWSTKTTWTGLISSDKNFIHLNQQRVSH